MIKKEGVQKLIAAVVGLVVVVLGPAVLGLSEAGTVFGIPADTFAQGVLGVLTATGVYAIPNKEKE